MQRVDSVLRTVPNFPKPGIMFKDITPLFKEPQLLSDVISYFAAVYRHQKPTAIVGIESRGFLFGVPLALELNIPFVLARKSGKLPADTYSFSYDLEYGSATLELHKDSIGRNDNVVIFDDLLATGGTAVATAELVKQAGGSVLGYAFLISLDFLNGRERLADAPVNALLSYE
ncbi:MAG: adenine phosphoribosyltransferase [Proteobacteria bacterium]|nr:adenine phosphoribosyltransferase [Pseudomonadota bacterium]